MIFRRTLDTAIRIDRTIDRLDRAVFGIIQETRSLLSKLALVLSAISATRSIARGIDAATAKASTVAGWARGIPRIGPGVASFLTYLATTFGPAAKAINAALDRVSLAVFAVKNGVIPLLASQIQKLDPNLGTIAEILDEVMDAARLLEQNQRLIERFLPQAYKDQINQRLIQIDAYQGDLEALVVALETIKDSLKAINDALGVLQAALDAKNKALQEFLDALAKAIDAIEAELDNLVNFIPEGFRDYFQFLFNQIKLAVLQARAIYLQALASLLNLVGIDLRAILRKLTLLYNRTLNDIRRKFQSVLEAIGAVEAFLEPLNRITRVVADINNKLEETVDKLNEAREVIQQVYTLLLGIGRWKRLVERFLPFLLIGLRRALEEAEKQLNPEEAGGTQSSLRRSVKNVIKQARFMEDEILSGPIAPIQLESVVNALRLTSGVIEQFEKIDRIAGRVSTEARRMAYESAKALDAQAAILEKDLQAILSAVEHKLPGGYFEDLERILGTRRPPRPRRLIALAGRLPFGISEEEVQFALNRKDRSFARLRKLSPKVRGALRLEIPRHIRRLARLDKRR